MTRVKAIISFSGFGYSVDTGQEFEIEDKGIKSDLERRGWIEPVETKKEKKATK